MKNDKINDINFFIINYFTNNCDYLNDNNLKIFK